MWVAAIGEAAERPVGYLGDLAVLFGRSTRALVLSPLKRRRISFVIVPRFQMRDHFGRLPQRLRQALL